jgi:two-component system, NtrC family, response regulator GlrR
MDGRQNDIFESLGEPAVNDALLEARLLGSSAALRALRDMVRSMAVVRAPVLICGETGTGKEVVARAIHYAGASHGSPFVPVNCGAHHDELLLSELFGHEKGAFTDAKTSQPGLVELAEGGTLFLDEVDSLTARAQVALLRFLQDFSYRSVGGRTVKKANVRILAATNCDIHDAVKQGRFRKDLLYRLDVLSVSVPALRERLCDVPLLAQHFIERFAVQYQKPIRALHPRTLAWMQRYPWPGNVRELENYLHKVFVLAPGKVIDVPDVKGLSVVVGAAQAPDNRDLREVPLEVARVGDVATVDDRAEANGEISVRLGRTLGEFSVEKSRVLESFEKSYLERVLRESRGNISMAARLAGKERRTFSRLIEKHGFDVDDCRDAAKAS